MKVTFNWLKKYVDFAWPPEELAERLTMLGIEVESIRKLGGEFEGIVVAQVLTREQHPNADRLSLCKVADGTGERQIVCGANNFKAGDKVPLILPGASLPPKAGEQPFTIKVGKIRGVESQGMMCSPQELGLPDPVDGLLILRADARVGQPFAEYLGRAGKDVVYDLEITPNRPDLNSVIGIAREISAVTGNPLRIPDPGSPPETGRVEDLVAVRVADAELCPRYTARVIRGVKVGPSPDWLRQVLESAGVRSISNVVDVTNFVMLECGEPLHAFDYHLIAKGGDGKPTIVVRRASEGEKFKTLDGQERTLAGGNLLIADETKAIALAGVMGGQNTEINPQTVDVLIESAYFKPQNIRATSKRLELRTESSYRFERGADVGICDWASRRAAQLILETAGGQLAGGVVDTQQHPPVPSEITLRHGKVADLLGVPLAPADNVKYLRQLGLKVAESSDEYCVVTPPSFRVDLKVEVDLFEEIGRLYGVDRIPSTPPRGAIGSNEFDVVHDQIATASRLLIGLGLNEAQGQTLISSENARAAGIGALTLQNPVSSDMDALRPSLLPGLLEALRHNAAHKCNDVALFEIGRVFGQAGGQDRPVEERRVAVAMTGLRQPLFWQGEDRAAKFDANDLKGLIEEFLEQFGVRGVTYVRREENKAMFLESASLQLGKFTIGEMGRLSPVQAKRYDLRELVLLAELNLDLLLARRYPQRSFRPLPAFPAIRRDVAMVVPEATTHEAVINAVRQTKPANLESVELFDIFHGKNVPDGQKSMAYAFTYRGAERTLTDAEANAVHEKIVAQLKQKLSAIIRES